MGNTFRTILGGQPFERHHAEEWGAKFQKREEFRRTLEGVPEILRQSRDVREKHPNDAAFLTQGVPQQETKKFGTKLKQIRSVLQKKRTRERREVGATATRKRERQRRTITSGRTMGRET